MPSPNPFAEDYGPAPPAGAPGAPNVPISGNPFEMGPVVSAPHPSTMLGNAADFLKAASNTATMGMRDRLEGATDWVRGKAPSYSEGVDRVVADSRMRRERSPYISTAGDVAGGAAQATVPGVGVAGRSISAGLGGSLPARLAGYGIEGAALGAGQAAGQTYSEKPQDYAENAIKGGAFGALVGAPFGKFADVNPRSLATVPNSGELKAASKNAYDLTHQIPVAYDAPHFWGGLDALEQQILRTSNPVRSPSVFDTIERGRGGRSQMGQPGVTGATVSPKDIDALRQQLTGVAEPGAGHARRWLDSYMQDPSGVVRGTDAQRAEIATLLNQARGDWRAGKRTETVENTNQYAEDRAATANSGANSGNTYRQKLVALLAPNSREGKWYNPAEKADIRDVTSGVAGEGTANLLRSSGNFLKGITGQVAGGGGLVTAIATGDVTPAAAMLAYPAGAAIKGVGNQMTIRHAGELADKMAMRSPLYRDRAANAPTVAGPGLGNFAEGSRNAVTNQLLEQLRLRGYMDGDPNAP